MVGRIVGAGTFGAPASEQVTGIPLQYNLLTFDPQTGDDGQHEEERTAPRGLVGRRSLGR